MAARIAIEINEGTSHQAQSELKAVLHNMGFEPQDASAERRYWRLCEALRTRGLDVCDILREHDEAMQRAYLTATAPDGGDDTQVSEVRMRD